MSLEMGGRKKKKRTPLTRSYLSVSTLDQTDSTNEEEKAMHNRLANATPSEREKRPSFAGSLIINGATPNRRRSYSNLHDAD